MRLYRQRNWMFVILLIAATLAAWTASAGTAAAQADDSPQGSIKAIHVFPPDVHLSTMRDQQSIIVQALESNGITRDVTAQAEYQLEDASLARIEGGVLHGAKDGQTQLTVRYQGISAKLPITVEKATVDPPISFRNDVMPVFMRAGCNQGSCHGAARGKDGFRLSLFGFDPEGDYFRLTREIPGRRINLAMSHASLLLEKATGEVAHSGGERFSQDSQYHATLLRWLESGALNDEGEVPSVVEVQIYPQGAVLDGQDATQQLTVRAKYSDGTDRDVTSLAYFSSNNENSATISQEGVVSGANRGEAYIMARFDTHTVGTHFIVLPKGLEFSWAMTPEFNYIDHHINEKLRKLRINPSDICSDEQFLRRVSLDITGLLPTAEEYEQFTRSEDPQKRARLVDDLLERKEFVEMWVMKWAELLQIRTQNNRVSYKSTLLYYDWLKEQISQNVPIDQLVQQIIGSQGGTFANPATNYYQIEQNTLKTAENVAQVFMGMRIQCAQCHNHPFDRWTMDDYYQFSAFFSQIGRKRAEDPREQVIYNRGGGEVRHPVTKANAVPKFLGGDVPDVKGKDRRQVLAQWLASPDNPYFARNLSNVVWAHFFGRGIIHEVDDVRVSNPAVNPELLDALATHFTEYDYDFKRLVRDICTSRTYQLSTQTNETNKRDDRNFSHAALRRLRAEVMLDIISQVTGTKNKFRGLPLGARAVQIADGNTSTYFLTTFGRASRTTVCSCEVKMEPNLSQALHLLNGDSVNAKVQQGKLVERRLAEGKTPHDIIDELYVSCLARKPTPEELQRLNGFLTSEKDDKRVLEDIFWALLNSREFVFNH